MTPRRRIFVAGGASLVGTALIQHLRNARQHHLVGAPPHEPELSSRSEVDHFFAATRPEVVIVAAGRSGGILANQSFPADLMLDNLLIGAHVLAAAFQRGVDKLLYLGSSCMYPRNAAQPLRPEALLTGPLEATSAAYATAKLAGLTLCQAYRRQHGAPFITAIPATPFGPDDDFDEGRGHVIPALMRRLHEAKAREEKTCTIWGSGSPRREFIFAPDLADACLCVIDHWDEPEPINMGSGEEVSIADLAALVANVVGYRGELIFDRTLPDGAPRTRLDCSKLFGLGWRPRTPLRVALERTYAWFIDQPEPRHVRVAV